METMFATLSQCSANRSRRRKQLLLLLFEVDVDADRSVDGSQQSRNRVFSYLRTAQYIFLEEHCLRATSHINTISESNHAVPHEVHTFAALNRNSPQVCDLYTHLAESRFGLFQSCTTSSRNMRPSL